ncbi:MULTISPECIES: carbon-nitrogen hydrolase family protein [Desulfococcus]|uniref:Nitrilase/cyanide hydratase and apolipoprotein N-acyltransferase n=1 Tax=Desulfococcus multivorans DSM 2059 TaxID=1121405 RepID=S7U6V6_DESML|nr:bifunctional GNAT family N-acetyltransferase/carbon-nitrogen hydrolase family protein [Desulfococcus multivorans]AOY58874.1 nitrilase/cyanide hydratase and apolipoprotein N-acyltransferase [Desulfococcus multivorans]EPR44840.1 Nitrilase/cyanide hydratase and apolipoprotein N-acyltransferase [Desulfococcus multivorans DSM 2059]SJZ52297.1 Predicted amidohydrolase [Desulfococcus multivorans DSM 2059]
MGTDITSHKLQIRNLRLTDYDNIRDIMKAAYAGMGGAWQAHEYKTILSLFPEGQICIEDKGRVVAAALTLIIDYAGLEDDHSYEDIVSDGSFKGHDPKGDYLYGIDLFVHNDYRGMRLGRRLYDARKELCEKLNLKGIIIGGRIPGYAKYHREMSPVTYIEKVRSREIVDPVLTFQLANEFHPKRVIRNYIPEDNSSRSHAVFLEWNNIFYESRKKIVWGRKSNVRIGVVQWKMRAFKSFEELLQQVEFFIDTVSGYNADLILFPELFNAPLLGHYSQDDPPTAMRALAEHTERLRDEILQMAVAYNINIVAGSLPEYVGETLHNVSFLCRRDGTWDAQYKLHITPDEAEYWGLKGGDALKVFDTDIGKIGILICYDAEFPELSRLLADRGMQILLVPFWTDTKNGYLRIRRCAQARAIENECYVAISGSVGNLPKIENMDIQYSQSAIFTPSDFAFPHDAVAAEATPNTEMTLVTDLDLDLLKELRKHGSVRNLDSRRKELYSVRWLK